MARRASVRAKSAPTVIGNPLPKSWRTEAVRTWQISAMMAKIGPVDYESTALRFETYNWSRGILSDDWARDWKMWCNDILYRRAAAERAAVSEPEFGPGMFG